MSASEFGKRIPQQELRKQRGRGLERFLEHNPVRMRAHRRRKTPWEPSAKCPTVEAEYIGKINIDILAYIRLF
jgi:hypothetical protein